MEDDSDHLSTNFWLGEYEQQETSLAMLVVVSWWLVKMVMKVKEEDV